MPTFSVYLSDDLLIEFKAVSKRAGERGSILFYEKGHTTEDLITTFAIYGFTLMSERYPETAGK